MKTRILMIDDEPDMEVLINVKFYKKIREGKLEFIFAHNGLEGIDKLQENPDIEIVLIDLNMPGMDGLTFLSTAKKQHPIFFRAIIITAYGDMENIRAAMNNGAFDFLVKPIDFRDLEITIDNALKDIQQEKRLVNERQKAEKEQKRLMTAIDQSAESVVITDERANVQYANPAFEKNSGYEVKELIGKNLRILKSGKQDAQFYREMWETITAGHVWRGRLINKKKDGELFNEEMSITPIRDHNGKIINFVGVKRDITNELKMEKQLRESQKMEAIGRLAGGIAHDFNNLLFAMLGYICLAKSEISPESVAKKDLEEALQAGNRARDLIQQILTFSRQNEIEFQVIELGAIVDEALKLLRAATPSTVIIHLGIDKGRLHILGDSVQLHQIVLNLCTNAIYAMEGTNGQLDVSLKEIILNTEQALQIGIDPGHYAQLMITDTGEGIASENLERIFDPFFSTKPVGEGTGLGLSVVHGIVQKHQGIITVNSEVGHGTAFHVYLPIIKEESYSRKDVLSKHTFLD